MQQMASETNDLFGCPFCGFRVRTTDDTCPRCGNKFSDGTLFECPFCGDMVAPGIAECPSCHVNFSDFISKSTHKVSEDSIDSLLMEIISLESSQIKREDKKNISCPKCSWMLDGSEDKCPKCGANLSEDASLQCPICGSFVNSASTKCSECGTLFAGDKAAAEEQRTAQQDAISSALTDILSSAGHTGPLPEIEKPKPLPVEEPPFVQAPLEPEPAKVPEDEPVAPALPEPEALPAESAEEAEPAPKKPAPATGPKKSKQRKLKAKTSGAKPSK